ncbi:MAG: PorT family protein [Flavobacteriales bacterium]|nr:PorT family protein [Flavobacteriales bacterium]
MKKLIVISCIIYTSLGFAQFGIFNKNPLINMENFQKQRVHWGYFLGFNTYDFKFDYLQDIGEVKVASSFGFNVGLVGNLRINDYFDLRFEPGLYYTERDLEFPNFSNLSQANREAKSTYLHFPLLLKYSALRTGNVKPYLVGGFSTATNLASNSKAIDDNLNNRFRVSQWTYHYEIGFGVDIFTEHFIFSPSIRGVFGIGNELIPDNDPNSPWTSNISSMRSRGLLINFTFH